MCKIAENAGVNGQDVLINCCGTNLGCNALTNQYEDLVKTGIIDPAKVTRSALQNAASVAGMLLTTEVAIVDEPVTQENGSLVPQQSPLMM